jgi:hypothetical protein
MLISVILECLQEAILLTERVSFSWRNLRKRLFASAHLRLVFMLTGCIVLYVIILFIMLFVGLGYVLSFGSSVVQISVLRYALSFGLSYGLSIGLLYWLLPGLYQSIAQERIEDQDRQMPNQGVRLSLRNSLLLALISGAIIGGIGIVVLGLNNGLNYWLSVGPSSEMVNYWLRVDLSDVLNYWLNHFWSLFVASGILVWIITGGLAVWRHYLIRCLLPRTHAFPLNAFQFLDDATARILLQRLGGGYRFTHRLLLDSLADAMERAPEQSSASRMMHSELSVVLRGYSQ